MIAKFDQKGSILIGIIAAMVLFAALGTAILSLTSTATMNQVMANSAARAYYLAESGFRYAYNPGNSADTIESTLKDLHETTSTLANNDGSFKLEVYSYYLKVNGDHPQGSLTLNTKFPGGLPDDFTSTDETCKIQIDTAVYEYEDIIHNPDSVEVLFTNLIPPLRMPISDDTDVFFMALADGQQTVVLGEDILLKTQHRHTISPA